MDYKYPYVFVLLVFLFLYVYWYIFKYPKIFLSFSFNIRLPIFKKAISYFAGHLSLIFEIIVLSVILAGSAGPYFQEENSQITSRSVRIVWILLDVSGSMNTFYKTTTRLEYAKKLIDSLLIKSPDAIQYGLVIFAEQAYILSPPTEDYEFLKSLLKDIKPHYIQDKGTDIAKAFTILYAGTRQSELYQQGYGVILFSDGGENRSLLPYTNLVRYANKNSISISGICIGDSLVYDPSLKKIVRTDYNEESMRYLVKSTGGVYVKAGEEAFSSLNGWFAKLPFQLYQEIVWRKPTEISNYFYFVSFFFVLLLIMWKYFGFLNPLED